MVLPVTAFYGLLNDVPNFAAATVHGQPPPSGAERGTDPHPADAPGLLLTWDPAALSGALDHLVTAHPEAFSGREALPADPVPFRLVILDAAVPTPIQIHPRLDQALAGFIREQARGVPFTAGNRHYKDRYPKYEVAVALTPLRMLAGQRSPDELRAIADGLELPWLHSLLTFRHEDPIHAILRMTPSEQARALGETRAALAHYDAGMPPDTASADAATVSSAADVVRRLQSFHPGDRGILLAACMRLICLEPGQAMVTPAGCLHTYLSGKALVVMGTSANALTLGLTREYVDIVELQGLLREGQPAPSALPTVPLRPGQERIPLWSEDLDLRRIVAGPTGQSLRLHSFSVVLAALDAVVVTVGDVTTRIEPGSSVLYVGEPVEAQIHGPAEVFIASRT